MAKAKTRKRGTGRGGAVRSHSGRTAEATTAPLAVDKIDGALPAHSHTTRSPKRPNSRFGSPGPSGVLSTGMVALGCWGMTIFFFFLYPDPNHVLFGSMAALMALIWSYSLVARFRRQMRQRQV